MIILYGAQVVAITLAATFLVVGTISMQHYNATTDWQTKPEDQEKYLISKWTILFSVSFGLESLSFTNYVRAFKSHYVDPPKKEKAPSEEDLSADESDSEISDEEAEHK